VTIKTADLFSGGGEGAYRRKYAGNAKKDSKDVDNKQSDVGDERLWALVRGRPKREIREDRQKKTNEKKKNLKGGYSLGEDVRAGGPGKGEVGNKRPLRANQDVEKKGERWKYFPDPAPVKGKN